MEKTIKILVEKLSGIKYAFIGSTALWIRGIDIDPNDIDIVMDNDGVKKVAEIFQSNVARERGFLETYFDIDGFPIQALSYENNPVRQFDFDSEVEMVERASKKIPCMSLKSELKVYQALNRASDKETVKIIKKSLN